MITDMNNNNDQWNKSNQPKMKKKKLAPKPSKNIMEIRKKNNGKAGY